MTALVGGVLWGQTNTVRTVQLDCGMVNGVLVSKPCKAYAEELAKRLEAYEPRKNEPRALTVSGSVCMLPPMSGGGGIGTPLRIADNSSAFCSTLNGMDFTELRQIVREELERKR